jgi:hypothetical protein
VTFEVCALRFHFEARDSIHFPPGKSGNIARGAFGTILRKLSCPPDCEHATADPDGGRCLYAQIFKPSAAGESPSGLADWPRPFVFRAAHLDGCTIAPGRDFHFDVHLFYPRREWPAAFTEVFSEVASQGIGPRRGRARLASVEPLGEQPIQIDFRAAPARRAAVRFLTPTQLKGAAEQPEFGVLFGRIRDRISTLRALYGPGPLDIDFRAMGQRAAGVKITRCELESVAVVRRSSRTGQTHPIGGFIGMVEYEGVLDEFIPYLYAARWTGVGRHTVWGQGVMEVTVSS